MGKDNFRITFNPEPECEPFEYWCMTCKAMFLSYCALTKCPDCKTEITIKGKPMELDLDYLKEHNECPPVPTKEKVNE